MMKMKEIKEEKRDNKIKNPEIMNLEALMRLSEDPNNVLTDISDLEIFAESIYKAFNDNCAEIPTTLALFSIIKTLRPSRNREGRKEVLKAHQPRAAYNVYHIPFPGEEEEKVKSKSLFEKLLGK